MAFKYLLRIVIVMVSAGFLSTAAQADPTRIVAFGDSLMAGYRLAPGESFPEKLEAALREKGHDVTIANASVSGDTTSAGLSRLDWSVPDDAEIVLVELGANDMLRGVSPEAVEENLDAIIERLKERGASVVLAGMLAAPNLGNDYAAAFDAIYPRLAEKHGIPLQPFILDGVAANASLQLDDGMHPNAAGVDRMVENLLPVIEPLLADGDGES